MSLYGIILAYKAEKTAMLYTYETGSTKVISASNGPVPVSAPFKDRSKPPSERFLRGVSFCSRFEPSRAETYVMLAASNVRFAWSTRFWTMGGATTPMRYNAV